jgi:hypothetical protein
METSMMLNIPAKIDAHKFNEKIGLLCDPYFDREFFTNLIYCADRQKSIREIFEATLEEVGHDTSKNDFDSSILHFFFSYQTANRLRESYQWLSMAQGLYAMSIQRSDGQKALYGKPKISSLPPKAITPAEFEGAIRRDLRKVESKQAVWQGLLFLLENRTTRAQAIKAFIRAALLDGDPLSFELVIKGLDLCLSSGWRAQSFILLKPFERLWAHSEAPQVVLHGSRLAKSQPMTKSLEAIAWQTDWTEQIWKLASLQGAEAAWEFLTNLSSKGASTDQLFAVLGVLRGRALFTMTKDQWPRVAASLIYGEALQNASRWVPEDSSQFMAISVVELSKLIQLLGQEIPTRPTGKNILDGVSKNISKDRLILRLDDCVERGERSEALELLANYFHKYFRMK